VEIEPEVAPTEVDLVIYEARGRTFGSGASAVVRVARRSCAPAHVRSLGAAEGAGRALVVRRRPRPASPGGAQAPEPFEEVEVPIDRLIGFERASTRALRRLPEFALGLADPSVVGFVLRGTALVPLIDLEALVCQDEPGGQRETHAAARGSDAAARS
jgi:hypothetical protein